MKKHPAKKELHTFLEEKYLQYNTPAFISSDPISVPHRFQKKEDIEISGFLTSLIAWGRRDIILKSAGKMIAIMQNEPWYFLKHTSSEDWEAAKEFVHRTFNGNDFIAILSLLKEIYREKNGLEKIFSTAIHDKYSNAFSGISALRKRAESHPGFPHRTLKHLADPEAGSSAKRLNMFLRWMARDDKKGVDFGLWKGISPSLLICPLDVHTGNTGRKLGLLQRKQNDRRAAEELTCSLKEFDANDPVKYDFALFGLGVFENF